MKNKKIILGLGTITALGAMSVGFIACVKKKEIEDMNLSKLTEDQIKKIVKDIIEKQTNLTKDEIDKKIQNLKEQLKKLISENKDSKILAELFIKTNLTNVRNILTSEIMNELDKPIAKDSITKYRDIGHFAAGSKKKDLINKINQALNNKGWEVVVKDKTILEQDAASGNNQPISFKLKKTVLGVEIVTSEDITFNYSLGKYNMGALQNVEAKSGINDITDAIKELNKREEFKNIQIDSNDVELDGVGEAAFKTASYTEDGFIKLKSKTNSKKVTGKLEIKIPQLKRQLIEDHLGDKKEELSRNGLTVDDVLVVLNNHNHFKTNNTLDANDIELVVETPATIEATGSVKIKAKDSSRKVKGEITLTIPKLKKPLNTLITVLDLGGFESKPNAAQLIDRIKEKNSNNADIKSDNLGIDAEDITDSGAKVKGKGAYTGDVNVIFEIKTNGDKPGKQ